MTQPLVSHGRVWNDAHCTRISQGWRIPRALQKYHIRGISRGTYRHSCHSGIPRAQRPSLVSIKGSRPGIISGGAGAGGSLASAILHSSWVFISDRQPLALLQPHAMVLSFPRMPSGITCTVLAVPMPIDHQFIQRPTQFTLPSHCPVQSVPDARAYSSIWSPHYDPNVDQVQSQPAILASHNEHTLTLIHAP